MNSYPSGTWYRYQNASPGSQLADTWPPMTSGFDGRRQETLGASVIGRGDRTGPVGPTVLTGRRARRGEHAQQDQDAHGHGQATASGTSVWAHDELAGREWLPGGSHGCSANHTRGGIEWRS